MTGKKLFSQVLTYITILLILSFIFFYFLWFPIRPLFLIILSGLGTAVFFLWILLRRLFRGRTAGNDVFQFSATTPEMLEEALKEGNEKLNLLTSYGKRITDDDIQNKLKKICGIIEKILDDLRVDPKDLSAARQFLHYYLEATIKIVKRYVEVTEKGTFTAKQRALVQRFGSTLDMINSAFEKQLSQLLENDFMDLDAEIKLFERTMKMEGLSDEDF